jgi:CSLREA domain-containing protein
MMQSMKNGSEGSKSFLALGLLLAVMTCLLAARSAYANTTFTVNLSGDAADAKLDDNACDTKLIMIGSQCTLRAALQEANDTAGPDTINFNIPGDPAYHTISPDSGLPDITDEVTIDGYSQPGASPNTLTKGDDAVLKIELNGTDAGNAAGLDVRDESVIRGLVINRFERQGIVITSPGDRSRVEGNFIGTDPTGTADLGNEYAGVDISGRFQVSVGGSSPEARNLISGNDRDGVEITANAYLTQVQGNYIGTNRSGKGALGNSLYGVYIAGAAYNHVGSNTIAFNDYGGVYINAAGNDPTNANGNTVTRNSVFANGDQSDQGIYMGWPPNDPGDADIGPNTLQNKPVVTSARASGGQTTIKGRLSSTPEEDFTIEIFSNPSGTDQGKRFLGEKMVTTGQDGKANFTLTKKVPVGLNVTATATNTGGSTSEFSAPRTVVAS